MEKTKVATKINSYLSFKLGDEVYAANVSKVLNILEMCKITKVPRAPEYMKGVINLRGTVLPLVDTRIKFGMEETEYSSNTCILVMELQYKNEQILLGALVDAVVAVIELEDSDIQPPPSIGDSYRSEFISGVTKSEDDEFIMILDIDKLFSVSEIAELKQNQGEAVE